MLPPCTFDACLRCLTGHKTTGTPSKANSTAFDAVWRTAPNRWAEQHKHDRKMNGPRNTAGRQTMAALMQQVPYRNVPSFMTILWCSMMEASTAKQVHDLPLLLAAHTCKHRCTAHDCLDQWGVTMLKHCLKGRTSHTAPHRPLHQIPDIYGLVQCTVCTAHYFLSPCGLATLNHCLRDGTSLTASYIRNGTYISLCHAQRALLNAVSSNEGSQCWLIAIKAGLVTQHCTEPYTQNTICMFSYSAQSAMLGTVPSKEEWWCWSMHRKAEPITQHCTHPCTRSETCTSCSAR